MASNSQPPCAKCADMVLQRSYLKTLEDKRNLLMKLQNEQDRSTQLTKEVEMLRTRELERLSAAEEVTCSPPEASSSEESRLQRRLCEAMELNKKWKTEYQQLKEKYNTEMLQLQEELRHTRTKLENSTTRVLALESEVVRLAEALQEKQSNGNCDNNGQADPELVKQQMQAFREDFSCEKRDRERVQSEKATLQEQLSTAQEIIATLTQEVDMYKEQCDRLMEENRMLSLRRYPASNAITQPQLQIVYPIGEPNSQEHLEWQRRRQQQNRRGVFTRGPTIPPPSAFYGGDVEPDSGVLNGLHEGYRTM